MIRPLLRLDLLHEMRMTSDPLIPVVEKIYAVLDEFYQAASQAGLHFQSGWVVKVFDHAINQAINETHQPYFAWSAEGIYLSSLFEDLVEARHGLRQRAATGDTIYTEVSTDCWVEALRRVRDNLQL